MEFGFARRVSVGLAVGVTVASGCSTSGSEEPSPPTTVDKPKVARTLAAAPTSCPGPKPRREQVSPDLAPLAGRRPVWAGFYANLDEKTGALRLPRDAPRTNHGWRIKVLWVVADDQQALIRLHGREMETGTDVWFEVGEPAIATTGVLDPERPGTVTSRGEPKEFPSYLHFPAAGCYELQASWPGNSWKMVVGVGR